VPSDPRLRPSVRRVDLDDATVLLDTEHGVLLQLSGPARTALEGHGSEGPGLLEQLGLADGAPVLDRRRLLEAAAAAAALGVTAMVLPSAGASASTVGPALVSGDDLQLDTSFQADMVDWFATTRAILTLDEDRLLVGGTFGRVGADDYYGNLALLQDDGTPAASFAGYLTRPLDAWGVFALANAGGTLIAGGDIQGIQDRSDPEEWITNPVGFPVVSVATDGNVARVTTGELPDDGFPASEGTVHAIAVDGIGRLLVAGSFESVDGVPRRALARLHRNGEVDTTFDANVNATLGGSSSLFAVAVQGDGRIVIGGQLYDVGGVTRFGAARLQVNGALDPSFDPNTPDRNVHALAIDDQDRILVGGAFENVVDGAGDRVPRVGIARFLVDGNLDTSFDANLAQDEFPEVRAIVAQSDDRILIGGAFATVGGVTRRCLARLQPNGAVDAAMPDVNVHLSPNHVDWFGDERRARVDAIAVDRSGRVVIGGDFNRVSGQTRRAIARLEPGPT
jgi:uncharacterized delta-60 repeat protein